MPGQGMDAKAHGAGGMTTFLLDNNHLGAAIRKVSTVRDRIGQFRRAGHRFGTCLPALCELEAGVQGSSKPQPFYRRLTRLLEDVRIWPADLATAKIYGTLYHRLKRAG